MLLLPLPAGKRSAASCPPIWTVLSMRAGNMIAVSQDLVTQRHESYTFRKGSRLCCFACMVSSRQEF